MNDEIEKLSSILKDVKPENCFWINNGPIIMNIYELVTALQNIDAKTFYYHVNKDKNDFSEWIKGTLNDNKLAEDLLKTRNQKKTIKKIKKRISYIEKRLDEARKEQAVETKEGVKQKEFSLERMFLELIVSFILGIIVGIVIGILIEYYSIIPKGWF